MKIRPVQLVFRSKIGYTLSEVLVAAVISVLLLGAIFMSQILGRQIFDLSSAFVDVNSKARIAMDWMVRDARWANQIAASRTFGVETYSTGDSVLILEIPAINGSGDVLDSIYDYFVYYLDPLDSAVLKRTVDADAASSRSNGTRTVANNVNALVFSSGGTGLSSVADVTAVTKLQISLTTLGSAAGMRTVSEQLNTEVDLRNK